MIRIIDEELREACATGDEAKAQILIGQGANVNSSNKVNGWTALHWAAYRGHRGLVMFLLNKGADPTVQNIKGETVMSLLANYSLDLLEGNEVEEGKQYPLPTQQETLSALPIMPNYIRNPMFPYNTKKDTHNMMTPVTPPPGLPKGTPSVLPAPVPQPPRPVLVQVPPPQGTGGRSNSASPQLPSASNPTKPEQQEVEADSKQGGLAPSMLSSAAKPGSRYQQPHSKPNPNWVYSGSGHRPTMITAQPLFQNQMRSGGNIQMNHVPGHPQMVSGPHRYPVSSMPVSSEYPIQRIMRPVYGAAPAGAGAVPVQMSGVPSGNLVHWGYNSQPHYRPQAGMVPVPQSIQPVPSPGPNPPLPSSPQVVNVPDSTQDKEMTTPVKESPVRSPTANSANSSPSADATIKVRLAGSEDFFEVELVDIGDSYNSLVTCFAEELDVKSETVAKIRKLPNILIRKDRDVKRIKNGSEFEVELNPES